MVAIPDDLNTAAMEPDCCNRAVAGDLQLWSYHAKVPVAVGRSCCGGLAVGRLSRGCCREAGAGGLRCRQEAALELLLSLLMGSFFCGVAALAPVLAARDRPRYRSASKYHELDISNLFSMSANLWGIA